MRGMTDMAAFPSSTNRRRRQARPFCFCQYSIPRRRQMPPASARLQAIVQGLPEKRHAEADDPAAPLADDPGIGLRFAAFTAPLQTPYAMCMIRDAYLLRGEVKILTGGMGPHGPSPRTSEPGWPIRCESGADGIVRMKVTESTSRSFDALEGTRCSRARVPFLWLPCPISAWPARPAARQRG